MDTIKTIIYGLDIRSSAPLPLYLSEDDAAAIGKLVSNYISDLPCTAFLCNGADDADETVPTNVDGLKLLISSLDNKYTFSEAEKQSIKGLGNYLNTVSQLHYVECSRNSIIRFLNLFGTSYTGVELFYPVADT